MDITKRLADIASRFSGDFVLAVEHLTTGETIQFGDAHRPMESASVMKVPILLEALRQCQAGELDLLLPQVAETEDFVEGSGLLQYLSGTASLPLQDVLTLMIIVSDNIATNMVLRQVGIPAVNRFSRELGLPTTTVHRKLAFDVPDPLGTTTAFEMVYLLAKLYRGQVLDAQHTALALDILGRQQYQWLLTRKLPYELLDDNGDAPPRVRVLSKSGSLTGIRNDVGLVLTPWGDYAIALLSQGSHDERFHIDTEAHVVLPEASRAVFDYFCPGALRP